VDTIAKEGNTVTVLVVEVSGVGKRGRGRQGLGEKATKKRKRGPDEALGPEVGNHATNEGTSLCDVTHSII
jgi:hypothetical protein